MQSENRELFQAKWGERRRHTSFTCETQDSVEKPPNQGLMLNGHWARNRKHRGPREAATQQLIFILKQELPCDSNLRAMCGSYLGIYLEIPYEWMMGDVIHNKDYTPQLPVMSEITTAVLCCIYVWNTEGYTFVHADNYTPYRNMEKLQNEKSTQKVTVSRQTQKSS